MEAPKSLKQRALVEARRLIAALGRPKGPKVMFALSSSGYCAIHSLVIHDFSVYVFAGGLAFGAIAALVFAWLSNRFSSLSA